MKTERASATTMKSTPRPSALRKASSPPRSAKGISSMEEAVVASARRTDQNERTFLEMRPARGMVREPTIGTKMVRMMMV